jgi:hypothetical protein
MPAPPKLIVALDALLAALNAIGPAGATWFTDPVVTEGIPGDALPAPSTPRLYAQFVRRAIAEGEAGTRSHHWRGTFVIWIVADTHRGLLEAEDDVARALYATEGTIRAAIGQPWWYDEFEYDPELRTTGAFIGHRVLFVEYEESPA